MVFAAGCKSKKVRIIYRLPSTVASKLVMAASK
jgi:hypothetical protein